MIHICTLYIVHAPHLDREVDVGVGEHSAEVGGQNLGGHGVRASHGQRGVDAVAKRRGVNLKVPKVQPDLLNL